jgi:hypothetical protein
MISLTEYSIYSAAIHRFLHCIPPPKVAAKLAGRLEIHFTSKHGSWLKIAEIELSSKRKVLDITEYCN